MLKAKETKENVFHINSQSGEYFLHRIPKESCDRLGAPHDSITCTTIFSSKKKVIILYDFISLRFVYINLCTALLSPGTTFNQVDIWTKWFGPSFSCQKDGLTIDSSILLYILGDSCSTQWLQGLHVLWLKNKPNSWQLVWDVYIDVLCLIFTELDAMYYGQTSPL